MPGSYVPDILCDSLQKKLPVLFQGVGGKLLGYTKLKKLKVEVAGEWKEGVLSY